jgi:flagellin-like hook-associated protein FlgL
MVLYVRKLCNLYLESYSDNIVTTSSYKEFDVVHGFIISKKSTDNYTPNYTLITNYTEGVTPVSAEQQQIKYTLTGTIEEGDKYIIGPISYTVQLGDSSIDDIVNKLFLGFSGSTPSGISGSPIPGVSASIDLSGNLLLTANTPGVPFDVPVYQAINKGTNDQKIVKTDTVNNVTAGYENNYDISGFITEGNSYNIGGAVYTVQNNDSKDDIINGLVNSINGLGGLGVSGTSLSGVTSYKNSTGKLVIKSELGPILNYPITSNINLSHITSSELENDITVASNSFVNFNSSTNKYLGYVENAITDYNETQNIDTQNIAIAESLSVLKNINTLTIKDAQNFLSIVDLVLNTLNTFKSEFGSAQNQVESALRTMLTCETNIKNAESVLRDVDYAEETANFSKFKIISDAAVYSKSKIKETMNSIIDVIYSSGRQ